jgi:hypothetical protein
MHYLEIRERVRKMRRNPTLSEKLFNMPAVLEEIFAALNNP